MPDTVHYVMWYTVYDAKTGDLLASGTSELCARRLGYKSANSFASACSHSCSGRHPAHKYIFEKEYIRLMRWTVCRRYAANAKRPVRAPTRTSPKGDEIARPITPKNTTLWRFCK